MTALDRYDWTAIGNDLDASGFATLPTLLTDDQCASLAALYDDDRHFRSHIHLARHGFGRGEYKYLRYPLPPLVEDLRTRLYAALAPIANSWAERLRVESRFPAEHAEYIARCHAAGQARPTPLLLRYGLGDYNCLHQDLYGEHVFPLQVIVMLDQQGCDYDGGELMLVEQRPRMQSIGHVLTPGRGDATIIAVNHRPQRGTRGDYRVSMKHGVSRLTSGNRHTLGIIFHDAA